MSNPLQPLDPPFDPEIAKLLTNYPQQNGYILTLFRTFANSERFLRKAVPNLLDRDSPLSLRTREIVILRTTANRNCEYEWGVHVAIFAKAAKLSADHIAATHAENSDIWSAKEHRLVTAIDQLCAAGSLEEKPLCDFQNDWTKAEQLEILALIGTYSTISFVANVAGLEPEPFAARFAGFSA
ncbi:MAG: carboxymuconolactone decarboxylase family protein [Parasphingorhabdus sp.]|uniref:carboxymuconolactone decarboxylase family protein n=1 Tax=Parasphingorhabdus sp. TaxID=2709688 RepID=UPI003298DB36